MLLFFFLSLIVICHCNDQCMDDADIINLLLNSTNYNKLKTPPKPVHVAIEIWIQDVNSISDITSDFTVDLYLTELWHDPRLSFENLPIRPCKNNITFTKREYDQIWKPNLAFVNSKNAEYHKSPVQNTFLNIYRNGTVWTTSRMKITGPCKITSNDSPFDTVSCSLTIESYSYNAHEVQLRWSRLQLELLPDAMRLPEFKFVTYQMGNITHQYPAGLWDEMFVQLQFQRRCKLSHGYLQSHLEQCDNSTSVRP